MIMKSTEQCEQKGPGNGGDAYRDCFAARCHQPYQWIAIIEIAIGKCQYESPLLSALLSDQGLWAQYRGVSLFLCECESVLEEWL